MTRYAIDSATAIRIVRERIPVSDAHQLVAPSRLRSDVLSSLYRAVRRGELSDVDARALLDGVTTLRIRLLGDRVSRAVAWRLAAELDWEDTTQAEYVAVAQLQADAFITEDAELAHDAATVVMLARFEDLARLD